MTRAATLSLLILCLLLPGCASTPDPIGAAAAHDPDDPLYPFTLLRQGAAYLQQGRHDDALARFTEAARSQPRNATVYNMMGLCYLKMERHQEAVDAFTRALDLVPSFTDARNNRGAAYQALERYDMAELDFIGVLGDTTYPHRWQVYYNLGVSFLQRNDLVRAEENLLRAATAPSPVFSAFLRLSEIAESKGRRDLAIDYLEEAHLKFPDQLEATFQLGRVLVEAGQAAQGRRYLEEVTSAGPSSEQAKQARRLLEQL